MSSVAKSGIRTIKPSRLPAAICWAVLWALSGTHGQALADEQRPAAEAPILPPGRDFGVEFPVTPQNAGPMMDVAVADDLLVAVGGGKLIVFTGARNGSLKAVGQLAGLGNVRQVAVATGHAFVTAREDGLFVVDVREPTKPRLVCHYDTAELATGIAVSGEVAAVANRFAGIELLDVSDPKSLKHLSTIRVGEAQSVVFHGDRLYAGLWSEKAVAVIDVGNPWTPKVEKTVPLDGCGDGLDVRGDLLAVATGHHARSKDAPKPGDPIFGRGHGVEFFDIRDPTNPKRLSGVKFPPFYRLGMDMWGCVLSGDHAYVNDTHNGFFLIDVKDPKSPRLVGHRQLPAPKWTPDPSPVTGLAVSGGRAFLAGAFDDLHLVETGVKPSEEAARPGSSKVPPPPAHQPDAKLPAYKTDGAIRAVLPWRKDLYLVAAGSAGVHVVRRTDARFELVAKYPTGGFARDVAAIGEAVYVAESLGGLTVWKAADDNSLQRIGQYIVPGKSIHQVSLADGGGIGFLAVGGNTLHVVKLEASGKVERIYEETPKAGLFYREPFSPVTSDGHRLLVQWHTQGLVEYEAKDGKVRPTGYRFPHAMDTECGAAPWPEGWIATSRRGLFLLREGETRSPAEVGLIRPDGRPWPGKPVAQGRTVLVSDPFSGQVTAIDLTDPSAPRVLSRLSLNGHPGRVRIHDGKAIIPAGRDGLLLWAYNESPSGK